MNTNMKIRINLSLTNFHSSPPGIVEDRLPDQWPEGEREHRRDKSPDPHPHKFHRIRDKASKRRPD